MDVSLRNVSSACFVRWLLLQMISLVATLHRISQHLVVSTRVRFVWSAACKSDWRMPATSLAWSWCKKEGLVHVQKGGQGSTPSGLISGPWLRRFADHHTEATETSRSRLRI